jgi:hydrogenase expression/formation protein HypE
VSAPGVGLDTAAIKLADGSVMVLTTDPISYIPEIGPEKSAWMSVNHLASDFTTSGIDPEYALFDYNFPATLSERDLERYLRAVGRSCDDLGISIVGGHTGTYPGAGLTVIGAGVLVGTGEEDRYISASMARPGDDLFLTKGAGIEAAAILSVSFPERIMSTLGNRRLEEGRSLVVETGSVVEARLAASIGTGPRGVTSMHDVSEGGVLGGVAELAKASGNVISVEPGKIFVPRPVREICSVFKLDPLRTLGGGALLITCRPGSAGRLASTLKRGGVPMFKIGRVEKKGEGSVILSGSSPEPKVGEDYRDRYWEVYTRGIRGQGS